MEFPGHAVTYLIEKTFWNQRGRQRGIKFLGRELTYLSSEISCILVLSAKKIQDDGVQSKY